MKYIRGRVSYLKEDMNLAKSIMKKKFDDYEKLKTLLAKNLGYIGKFTEFLMNENIPLVELETLYRELLTLKEKQLPVNINGLKYEQVLDTVQKSKESLLINSLVSQFPSEQKKFVKELLNTSNSDDKERNTNIILKVAQKEDLSAFVSKISRYKTADELKTALSIFSKDPINDRKKVAELLQSLKSDIVIDKDNIVIVKVDNYDDIVKLGSDTSWCIVKSSSTYDSYAKGRHQFIVYDYDLDEYDPKFKIGFTLTNDGGIHAAHDVLDASGRNNLVNILDKINVKTTDLIPKREPVVFDIKKLNSRTTSDRFGEIIEACDVNLLPQIIEIIAKTNKSDTKRRILYVKCFKRILGGKPYILESELDKISPFIQPTLRNTRYEKFILVEDEIDGRLEEAAFIKGLTIWTKTAYINMHFSLIKGIEEQISKPVLTKFSDIINNLYKDLTIKDFKNLEESEKGYKLSKVYESIMLLMNALCDRIKDTPDYDKIIKIPNSILHNRYSKILKLPIDLDESYDIKVSEEDIPYIVKKDYSNTGSAALYIKTNTYSSSRDTNLDKSTMIVNHLQGYKLTLRITKDNLKTIMANLDKYNPDGSNDKIVNILKQFNIKKLVSGKFFTDGTLTIKVV